jgi:excisionase family DNA binding protein
MTIQPDPPMDNLNGDAEANRSVPWRDRLALSVEEAGALLGISRDLAYDLVARGELPAVRLGRRLVVPRRSLENILDQPGPELAADSRAAP